MVASTMVPSLLGRQMLVDLLVPDGALPAGGESAGWYSHESALTAVTPRSAALTPPAGLPFQGRVVAELDDVRRQGVRPTTPLRLKVVGPDALLQPLPGNKGVDSLQKHLPTGLSLLVLDSKSAKVGCSVMVAPPWCWLASVCHNYSIIQSFPRCVCA